MLLPPLPAALAGLAVVEVAVLLEVVVAVLLLVPALGPLGLLLLEVLVAVALPVSAFGPHGLLEDPVHPLALPALAVLGLHRAALSVEDARLAFVVGVLHQQALLLRSLGCSLLLFPAQVAVFVLAVRRRWRVYGVRQPLQRGQVLEPSIVARLEVPLQLDGGQHDQPVHVLLPGLWHEDGVLLPEEREPRIPESGHFPCSGAAPRGILLHPDVAT
mmetsp:Transcript_113703/g.316640  ORF Transcript_113703/g.316640 Transcript_113703/m.316640 type:complete len:216 (+) Transcript_113703:678-1325(+)